MQYNWPDGAVVNAEKPRVTFATVSRSLYKLGGLYQITMPPAGNAPMAPRKYALLVYELGGQKQISPWLSLRELDAFINGLHLGVMQQSGLHQYAMEADACWEVDE